MIYLHIILLFATVVMVMRQTTYVGTLAGMVAKHGTAAALVNNGWWLHFYVTAALVTASIIIL